MVEGILIWWSALAKESQLPGLAVVTHACNPLPPMSWNQGHVPPLLGYSPSSLHHHTSTVKFTSQSVPTFFMVTLETGICYLGEEIEFKLTPM